MNIHEIIHSQLEAAIVRLCRVRDSLATLNPNEKREIGRQIESAAFTLEDIQYNWASLERLEINHATQAARTKPISEAS